MYYLYDSGSMPSKPSSHPMQFPPTALPGRHILLRFVQKKGSRQRVQEDATLSAMHIRRLLRLLTRMND